MATMRWVTSLLHTSLAIVALPHPEGMEPEPLKLWVKINLSSF
jgi:hypothetical protein